MKLSNRYISCTPRTEAGDVGLPNKVDALVKRVYCLVFSPMKRGRGRPRRTLGEFVKRGLVVNNIPKDLVCN